VAADSFATLTSSSKKELPSSQVRDVDPEARAARRVMEYLRAQGLSNEARVRELAENHAGEPLSPDSAVTAMQERVDAWRAAVFVGQMPDPLWLRTFINDHPQLFLGDVARARERARAYGNFGAGQLPIRAHFQDQELRLFRFPRWLLGLVPPLSLTMLACAILLWQLAQGGLSPLELAWVSTFALLFALGSLGAWVALLGFPPASDKPPLRTHEPLPRTALVMPIYHEDPEHVFAALLAMRESLAAVEGGEAFELFVLSDSRLPERAAEEERAFRRVAALGDARIPVYYRRRARNDRQKAGNLAEFFERFGHRYTYAVVLDADSLMSGETLVELARRMHAAPQLALLQAPLSLHGGRTLFARSQQFAASVLGPVFTRGLSRWAGPHGNYYGHNAIIRVRAFLDCCALPALAGEPPLGGHILSHDFVEAALLCRAGYEVRIAHDLSGSYEELPPTVSEYVARDRRWCQGNLQHVRIAFSEGLKPMSRVHMLVGALSYLVGPLWFMFVGLGTWLAVGQGLTVAKGAALLLTTLTALALLTPRVLGLVATLRDREARAAHDGAARLTLSLFAETALSALLSPVLMLHHTRIVLSILLGRAVSWGSQDRWAKGQFFAAARAELTTMLMGVAALSALWVLAPGLVLPLSPVWLPWLFAIFVVFAMSSERTGSLAHAAGLFRTPPETREHDLLGRAAELRAFTASDDAARFRDLVLDPVLLAVHLSRLAKSDAQAEPDGLVLRARERAVRMGPAALTVEERKLLTHDAASMRWLHREAWRHWPVESWQLGRETPQLPPEPGS
jgi:membrane glycosyltransferase